MTYVGLSTINPDWHARVIDLCRQISEVHRTLYPPPPDTQHYGVGEYFYSPEQGLRHNGWKAAFPSWASYHQQSKPKEK